MAKKRMFSLQIVDTDAFLDMPLSTQALYFHLSMRADDDGFVDNPKKIMKTIGSQDDDLKILIAKRFILGFDSGIVVIKHWWLHNVLRSDRYNETVYLDEKNKLKLKENKVYTEKIDELPIDWQPNGNQMATQIRLDKIRLDNNNVRFDEFWNLYDKKVGRVKTEKKWNKLTNDERKAIFDYLPKYIKATPDKKYRKNPETFLNNRSWEDEIILDNKNEILLHDGSKAILKNGAWVSSNDNNVKIDLKYYPELK